jgi:AraC-like DNA-binding protein/ligand-binding sensor protein
VANSTDLSEKLSQSSILRDYERAFSQVTGLPLKFLPAGKKRPGMRGSEKANPFCTQMAETEPGCKMCVDVQERLSAGSQDGQTHSVECMAGLTDSNVPVRVGEQILGYLQTGQVSLRQLEHDDFRRVVELLNSGGVATDERELEKAYFETRVISLEQYGSVLRLLEVFAAHLSIAAEQIAIRQEHAEPPMIEKARRFIDEHHREELTLEGISRAVNASTFHFCKMFKRATGMTFTAYLAAVRVSKSKQLLANPQMRISEVAFEAGFASLTHFNRMFRRIAGESPTAFRRRILKGL